MTRALVLAAGVLTAFAAPAFAATTIDRSSPAGIVRSFYAWNANHNVFSDNAATRPYFTSELYVRLASVVRAQDCTHSAIVDWDPFNGSQVSTAGYSVGTTSLHGASADVTVAIALALGERRFSGAPVTIVAQRGSDGWRIGDAIDRLSGSLLHTLRTDMSSSWWKTMGRTAAERACLGKPLP